MAEHGKHLVDQTLSDHFRVFCASVIAFHMRYFAGQDPSCYSISVLVTFKHPLHIGQCVHTQKEPCTNGTGTWDFPPS